MGGWQFWIDRGGTFTDIVARAPDGGLATLKLLSDSPELSADTALAGIRHCLGLAPEQTIPPDQVATVRMATTLATTALAERMGAPVVLVVSAGFADTIHLPEFLYSQIIEVAEQIGPHGDILRPLDLEAARGALAAAAAAGSRAVAIVLMHGCRYPEHERLLARLARDLGFSQISVSHEANPLTKRVGEDHTTVVDAYLSPVLRRHLDQLSRDLGGSRLMIMQSSGGLADARRLQGKDALLSGAAGGVGGGVAISLGAGFGRLIGIDMGGRSTAIWHYDGVYELRGETTLADIRICAPALDIHTVPTGGGSVLTHDGDCVHVGPQSTGANPGPTCYRRGGPLTLTDCNLALGRLHPDHFPSVFGPTADQPLDAAATRAGLARLAEQIDQSPEQLAEAILSGAVANVANAITQASIAGGYQINDHVLACFGGAGGQHACQIADRLGMDSVIVPPLAGVLSTYGLGLAALRVRKQHSIAAVLNEHSMPGVNRAMADIEANARCELERQGIDRLEMTAIRTLTLRYHDSDATLEVPFADGASVAASFAVAHGARFGDVSPGGEIVVEAATVEVSGGTESAPLPLLPPTDQPASPIGTTTFYCQGSWHPAAIFQRHSLRPGPVITGPALIVESTTTIVIDPGWQVETLALGHLRLKRTERRQQKP